MDVTRVSQDGKRLIAAFTQVTPDANRVVSNLAEPQTMTPARRDLELSELVGPLARILYRAMQLHALGAHEAVTYEDLTPAWRVSICLEAERALAGMSLLQKDHATTTAMRYVHEDIERMAFHLEQESELRERTAIRRVFQALVSRLRGGGYFDRWVSRYTEALTEPHKLSPSAQVALTALNGAGIGGGR